MLFSDWHNVWMPGAVNRGPWLTAYTLPELMAREVAGQRFVLPVCSFHQQVADLDKIEGLLLPPLFVEALDRDLREAIIARIRACFPYLEGTARRRGWQGRLDVVELPRPPRRQPPPPGTIAFSVDTAVEEHGPHLPLATDRIQSYSVLEAVAAERDDVWLAPPLDYGFLRWGLPAGMSVDLSEELTVRYTTRYVDALVEWARPRGVYVVDVHGSLLHRQAVAEGLKASTAARHCFRYLYDPIAPQVIAAGDFHAGGVETAAILHINPALVDPRWWPERTAELARDEMKAELAIQLTADMPRFIEYAETHAWNGIVGSIANFENVDGKTIFAQLCAAARSDLDSLKP